MDEYVQPTPFYRDWYNRAAKNLQPLVTLPAWNQPNRFRDRLIAHALLLEIGSDSIPELIRTTRSPQPEIRAAAATVLGDLGPGSPEAQACLLGLLGDRSVAVVHGSLEVLWMTAPDRQVIVPAIRLFLTHTNARVRIEASFAIRSVAAVPGPELATMVTLLSDSSGTVRANAARAIGLSGTCSEPIYMALAERLGDANPVTRYRTDLSDSGRPCCWSPGNREGRDTHCTGDQNPALTRARFGRQPVGPRKLV